MSSKLFTPLRVGKLELANRIAVSPMCQYTAADGTMTDWHLQHLANLALSGASLLIVEATGVTSEGRISLGCAGLYSDDNEQAMKRVIGFVRSISPVKLGIQLGHAGRKGSSHRPWQGRGPLKPEEGAWPTLAPSAVPLAPGWPTPRALDRAGMDAVRQAFVDAVRRAQRIGFDLIEVHSSHGYLLSEFLSPLANRRSDEYGGSLENRMRFPLEVFTAMRAAWPAEKPMGGKISGTDFAEGARRQDSTRAGLSGAIRGARHARGRHRHRRGGADQRSATGGSHSRRRKGRFRGAGARHAVRSTLAVARCDHARRGNQVSAAV